MLHNKIDPIKDIRNITEGGRRVLTVSKLSHKTSVLVSMDSLSFIAIQNYEYYA